MKNDFKIEKREIFLVLSIGLLGFVLSMKSFLLWLDILNPLQGLLVYYVILYSVMFILSKFGLVLFNFNIKSPLQVLGVAMITFAFFITVDWESQYVSIVTGHVTENVSNILFQSEDGAVWYLWSLLKVFDVVWLRILTYVITPMVLALGGSLLVSKEIEL